MIDGGRVVTTKSLTPKMERYILGKYGGQPLNEFLSADELVFIKNNMIDTNQVLYRGQALEFLPVGLSVGDEFEFTSDLRSFSSDFSIAAAFASGAEEDGLTPVMFRTSGSVSHFDVGGFSGILDSGYNPESESFVGGRFRVTSMRVQYGPRGVRGGWQDIPYQTVTIEQVR